MFKSTYATNFSFQVVVLSCCLTYSCGSRWMIIVACLLDFQLLKCWKPLHQISPSSASWDPPNPKFVLVGWRHYTRALGMVNQRNNIFCFFSRLGSFEIFLEDPNYRDDQNGIVWSSKQISVNKCIHWYN